MGKQRWLVSLVCVYFCVVLIKLRDIAVMGKRKRSVALIESDSDDDGNSGADIEAVIVNSSWGGM